MEYIINLLSQNQLLLLFTVIGVGFLIGNIKIFGFSLGISAVLFAGIFFGSLGKSIDLPEHIYIIGLVFFVYSIGLQSGPSFFSSFNKRGLKANMIVVALIAGAGCLTVLLWYFLGISAPSAVGLFCGSITNTPALAAAVEAVKNVSVDLPAEAARINEAAPVVSYGLAYPFGVLGAIIALFLSSKIFKINFSKESKLEQADTILSRTFTVINPGLFGKTVSEALSYVEHRGFALSRIKRNNKLHIITPEIILQENDNVIAVGNKKELGKALILFGVESEEQIDIIAGNSDGFSYKRLFVSNKEVVGKTIHDLDLEHRFGATITRLRRGDVDIVPSPNTIIEMGDRLRVVSEEKKLVDVTQFFGDSMKSLSETDYLSLSLGIVLGVLLGMIPIPLPNGLTFKLGFAGGPLIVGLIAGKLEKTGSIMWGMPYNANLVIRQIGLVLFQAGIGIKAGHGFMSTFQSGGWSLIASGALITSVVATLAIILSYKYLKLPMSAVMGLVSGMQTQPSCLAFSNQYAGNDMPNVWYATVYPSSMIAKILIAQILVSVLMMF